MTSKFGKYFRIQTWGESHGKAIGVVIDGVRPRLRISAKDIQKELDKRKPGKNRLVSPRKESDQVEILSGIFNGKTTGHPISLIIWNRDVNSSKYEKIKDIFRPGHAGFTYLKKYGIYDYKGGGRSSARETANWVMAGAVAKKLLLKKKIRIVAYVKEVGGLKASKIDLNEIDKNDVKCPDKKIAMKIEKKILKTKKGGDSLGGIIEVQITGVPAGLGDPVFERLDANLAKALMTINAVKGVEIGDGFESARVKGSQNNDEFITKKNKILTKTNHAGGILGGISNGMPIIAKIAVKPTSSILKEQNTVDIKGRKRKIRVEGRHDPCIAIRVPPIAEAMCALVLVDAFERQKRIKNKN